MPRRKQYRINRERLAKAVSKLTGIGEWFIQLVLINFLDLVISDLGQGNDVSLMEFGTFELRRISERPARRFASSDGLTSEPMRIPPRYRVVFVPSQSWKRKVLREHPHNDTLRAAALVAAKAPETSPADLCRPSPAFSAGQTAP